MATEDPIVATEPTAPEVVADDAAPQEEKPEVPAAEEKPKKAKKPSAKGKPRSPSLHPPYFEVFNGLLIAVCYATMCFYRFVIS